MKSYAMVFTPEAELEALSAYFWYEKQKPGLGEDFKKCLNSKIESLRQNPEAASYILRNVRSAKIKKFPYNLIYRIAYSQIQVIAIFHHSRNPKEWRKRI